MPNLFDYQVVCRKDDDSGYVAYVPAIAGCHAIGATPSEAQLELQNVFDMIRDEYTGRGESLPQDVKLAVAHAG